MSSPLCPCHEYAIHVACPLRNGIRVGVIDLSSNGTIVLGYTDLSEKFSYIPLWDVKLLWKGMENDLLIGLFRARAHYKHLTKKQETMLEACIAEIE
jgi:hypothetical protein